MTYSDKVIKALNLAETAEDIQLIIEKITSTDSINRRTVEGRKLTEDLLYQCNVRLNQMVDKENLLPF